MNGAASTPKTAGPPYFVAATDCFAQVADPRQWVKTGASSIDGAKRIATKEARSTTYTLRVAAMNDRGEFEVVAMLNNSYAITRRRATWKALAS